MSTDLAKTTNGPAKAAFSFDDLVNKLQSERDAALANVAKLTNDLRAATVEIEGLKAQMAMTDTRLMGYQRERDDAVADRATYEALFVSLQAQMRAFQVPATPLVKALADQKAEEAGLGEEHQV